MTTLSLKLAKALEIPHIPIKHEALSNIANDVFSLAHPMNDYDYYVIYHAKQIFLAIAMYVGESSTTTPTLKCIIDVASRPDLSDWINSLASEHRSNHCRVAGEQNRLSYQCIKSLSEYSRVRSNSDRVTIMAKFNDLLESAIECDEA